MILQTPKLGLPLETNDMVRPNTFNALATALDGLIGGTENRALKDLYVDPVGGDDLSADGTATRPFKTWTALQESGLLPQVIAQDTTVWIRPGTLREGINLSSYLLIKNLSIKANLRPEEVASFPFPFNLFFDRVRNPTLLTGPSNFTATGGTLTRIEKTGAGWTAGDLRGKFWVCTAGTNFFDFGRVIDNGTDWIDVTGKPGAAFDATCVIYLAEEAVLFKPADTSTQRPLTLQYNCGMGTLAFEGIDFEMGIYTYAYYCCFGYRNSCPISISFSSMRGNTVPTFAGASGQYIINLSDNPGSFSVDFTDFYIPAVKAGTTTGAFWATGPLGRLSIVYSGMNDNFQVWDGCTYFQMSSCGQKYRTGMLQYNYFRTVTYFFLTNTTLDFNNVAWGFRLDGEIHLDIRQCQMLKALGYAIKTYDHHGNLVNGLIEYTEINQCSINGVDVGGNSYLTFRNVTTDPAKKNGTWGLKARSGTQIAYLGAANTLQGNTGFVNLGDNVTNVNWGVPTTNTTHLTRIAAMGS